MSNDRKLTEHDLVQLERQFPKFQKDIIMSVVYECEFDLQRTILNLFEMSKTNHPDVRNERHEKVQSNEARIIELISNGWRVIVLMRGLPGSGKTVLAHQIFNACNIDLAVDKFILSTDEYFKQNGRYEYDVKRLDSAHIWNQERCYKQMMKGVSPLIIDNTNLAKWEMQAYCVMAVEFSYIIEVMEPKTQWARDPHILAKKNTHNVPKEKIIRMLNKFDKEITSTMLLRDFGLKYKQYMPQKRSFPPLISEIYPQLPPDEDNNVPTENPNFSSRNSLGRSDSFDFSFTNKTIEKKLPLMEYVHKFDDNSTEDVKNEVKVVEESKDDKEPEPIKSTSSIEPISNKAVTKESSVDLINFLDDTIPNTSTYGAFPLMPVQAVSKSNSESEIQLKKMKSNTGTPDFSNSHLTAWGTNEEALQSWETVVPLQTNCQSQTSMDFEIFRKIEQASNRSKVQMSDKMSNTSSEDFRFVQNCPDANGTSILTTKSRRITEGVVGVKNVIRKKITVDIGCMTEEMTDDEDKNHIRQLREVFPNIPIEYMLDVYEKCQKDLNWTIDLLSETEYVPTLTTKQSEINISKDPNTISEASMINSWEMLDNKGSSVNLNPLEKQKQQQEILDLKRKLEENVNFGKEHYSQHVWDLKNQRHGTTPKQVQETSNEPQPQKVDSDSDSTEEDTDETIQISLGKELVEQLEKTFGNEEFINEKFHTTIQLPISMGKQLHALYLQSICQQIEEQNEVISKDEAFAQKLESEEREALKGPDLATIMDEQLAHFYQKKDMEQYKTMSPDTLAIILKKKKLYAGFPSVAPSLIDTLLETHNYSYQHVLNTLTASVNQSFIDSSGNLQEPPITDDVVRDMKDNKALADKKITDENRSAEEYRKETLFYTQKAQQLQNLAHSYHQKGWGEVAVFYSKLAEDMKKKSEISRQKATFMHLYQNTLKLSNNNTLDLHFLTVTEALISLDVFIDTHISKLGKKQSEEFFVITGRGKRSPTGKSVLKPAVKGRLRRRNIRFLEVNPGLLKIKLNKDSVMSTNLKSN